MDMTPDDAPELLLILGMLSVARRWVGAAACSRFLVGPMRDVLERSSSEAVAHQTKAAAAVLATHCAQCRRCGRGTLD